MDLWTAPATDVRPMLTEERRNLLALLGSLTAEEWAAPSAAPGWVVKDLALHLLDDDLGWLSRGRDGDQTGLLAVADHASFVQALAAKNQRWIDGARGLSGPVLIELLEWSGRQMDDYYASMDLGGEGRVDWAGDAPAGRGTTVQVDLGSGGGWTLTSDGVGRWTLDEGTVPTRTPTPSSAVARRGDGSPAPTYPQARCDSRDQPRSPSPCWRFAASASTSQPRSGSRLRPQHVPLVRRGAMTEVVKPAATSRASYSCWVRSGRRT
ncbi:MAG: maleylpyruvate isomerase N-terminal domain-containing protein [Nocardioides sp.]